MTAYHISSSNGPAPCKAQPGHCPLGSDIPHFKDAATAESFAEKRTEYTCSFEDELIERGYDKASFDEDVAYANSNRNGTAHFFECGVVTDADTWYVAHVLARVNSKVGGQNNLGLASDLPVNPETGVRNVEAIRKRLISWREGIEQHYRLNPDDSVKITVNNEGGNASESDLLVSVNGGGPIPLEAKFGNKTDVNTGCCSVSTIIGTKAFNPSPKDKLRWHSLAASGEGDTVKRELHGQMVAYAERFNKEDRPVSSRQVYNLVYSSGSKDSLDVEPKVYDVVQFLGDGGVKFHEKAFTPETRWTVRAVVHWEGKSPRLHYVFEGDGGEVFDLITASKNSRTVDGVKVGAEFFTGALSYSGNARKGS